MGNNVRELIKEVLEKGYLTSLATQDGGGVWVCDVIYVHDEDLNVYWMSDPDVRHSKAILKNNKVSGTITVSGPGEKDLGIQFEGLAEKMSDNRFDLTKKHYLKRKKSEPKETNDVLQGDNWYVLRPKKIELINRKLFDSKETLDLK